MSKKSKAKGENGVSEKPEEMAEAPATETPNEAAGAAEAAAAGEQNVDGGPGMAILTQYVRDLSFENPGAPRFLADGEPEIGVNANVGARKLAENDYEVLLKFRVEAKSGEDAKFIAELEYCGIFRLANVPENNIGPVLLIEGPRQLFPFSRRIIADATRDGGYPPILLDPIDFVSLYQQGQAAREAEAAKAGEAGQQEPAPAD